jgi:hypothetical protein
MKHAEVYSQLAKTAHGFVWKWRASNSAKGSSIAFICYEDCVEDAQKNGYTVAPQRTPTAEAKAVQAR